MKSITITELISSVKTIEKHGKYWHLNSLYDLLLKLDGFEIDVDVEDGLLISPFYIVDGATINFYQYEINVWLVDKKV